MRKLFFACSLLLGCFAEAQVRASFDIDVGGMRNFTPQQKFWTASSTAEVDVHFKPKEALYGWIFYTTPGHFTNTFRANAISSATSPAFVDYKVRGSWRMRHFSLGWKHYFKGNFDATSGVSIYGRAGLGILFLRVENSFLSHPDTSLYQLQPNPINKSGDYKKLTADVGLGAEIPVAANIYTFAEIRTMFRASEATSELLHYNEKVPLPAMLQVGMRILFGY